MDARLIAEGLPRIGHYYDLCVVNLETPIDDKMITEFRFRSHLWQNPVYDTIVKTLYHQRGGRNYWGMGAHARDTIRRRYVINADGSLGQRRPPGFVLLNPEFHDDNYPTSDDDIDDGLVHDHSDDDQEY